jgi:hypothetical protein
MRLLGFCRWRENARRPRIDEIGESKAEGAVVDLQWLCLAEDWRGLLRVNDHHALTLGAEPVHRVPEDFEGIVEVEPGAEYVLHAQQGHSAVPSSQPLWSRLPSDKVGGLALLIARQEDHCVDRRPVGLISEVE